MISAYPLVSIDSPNERWKKANLFIWSEHWSTAFLWVKHSWNHKWFCNNNEQKQNWHIIAKRQRSTTCYTAAFIYISSSASSSPNFFFSILFFMCFSFWCLSIWATVVCPSLSPHAPIPVCPSHAISSVVADHSNNDRFMWTEHEAPPMPSIQIKQYK